MMIQKKLVNFINDNPKLSQAEIARRVGVTPAAITNYKKGREPEPEIAIKMLKLMKASKEEILEYIKNNLNIGNIDMLPSLEEYGIKARDINYLPSQPKPRKKRSFINDLRDIKQAYEEGLITEEEYNIKRRQILEL